ncbi:MAG: hypothetical protein WAL25_12440 [Acidimicrobiia bacterium]
MNTQTYPIEGPDTPRYGKTLRRVIRQLGRLANEMSEGGLKDEAGSLETAIADLEWQKSQLTFAGPGN